jgi:hypothetical protein
MFISLSTDTSIILIFHLPLQYQDSDIMLFDYYENTYFTCRLYFEISIFLTAIILAPITTLKVIADLVHVYVL